MTPQVFPVNDLWCQREIFHNTKDMITHKHIDGALTDPHQITK